VALRTGTEVSEELTAVVGRALIWSRTVSPPITFPNTVKRCGSRAAELSAVLKKNSLVALLGSAGKPERAIAIVPRTLDAPNSLGIGGAVGMCMKSGV